MSTNINTINTTTNGKTICNTFTLQEHMYLQTILLHMNASENLSTVTEDSNNSNNIQNDATNVTNNYVNKLWSYADILYTPDIIQVVRCENTKDVQEIKSCNLHLTKKKMEAHCKCTCYYNNLQPFKDMKTNIELSKYSGPSMQPTERYEWFYLQSLRRIICSREFNGGPLQYVKGGNLVVTIGGKKTKPNGNILHLSTYSNVCIGSKIEVLDSVQSKTPKETIQIVQAKPFVESLDRGVVNLETNQRFTLPSSTNEYNSRKKEGLGNEKHRFQNEPSTSKIMGMIGMACSGKNGAIANVANDVGVTIRWGEEDDLQAFQTIQDRRNNNINMNVDTGSDNNNNINSDITEKNKKKFTMNKTTNNQKGFGYSNNNINWITVTFDEECMKVPVDATYKDIYNSKRDQRKNGEYKTTNWNLAIHKWLRKLPTIKNCNNDCNLPSRWRDFKVMLTNLDFKLIRPEYNVGNGVEKKKTFFFQHCFFSPNHTYLWKYIRRRSAKVSKQWKLQPIYHHKYNMQSNDGSSCKKTMQRVNPRAKVNYITGYVSIDKNKKIQGVTAWETKQIYNKFVPVSISRNCYVCHATYRSDTKQFSIAFEDITNNNDGELSAEEKNKVMQDKKDILQHYVQQGNRVYGIGLKLLATIDSNVKVQRNKVLFKLENSETYEEHDIPTAGLQLTIEHICKGCNTCNNFVNQHNIINTYNRLSHNEFFEFYKIYQKDISNMVYYMLLSHKVVDFTLSAKNHHKAWLKVKRKVKVGNGEQSTEVDKSIGMIGAFYEFVLDYSGPDNIFHQYNDTKDGGKLKWRRTEKLKDDFTWPVLTDMFNKKNKCNVIAIKFSKWLRIMNERLGNGKKWNGQRWITEGINNESKMGRRKKARNALV